jgi:hypothetical protein
VTPREAALLEQLDFVRRILSGVYRAWPEDKYLRATVMCVLQSISKKSPKLKELYDDRK